ncbi:MAG: TIGR03086 family metal-binding protein [Jatrophihabitantaceae bacterium]
MTGSTDIAELLRTALQTTGQVVEPITDEQWTAPTPCSEWDVRELLQHLVAGNRRFAAILRGEQPSASAAGDDTPAGYRTAAEELLLAVQRPGALDRIVTVPFGTVPAIVALDLRITELLVHGWDLARATGQQLDFPGVLTDRSLRFTRARLGDLPPDRAPFAPPQPCPADAAPIEQLVALLGRSR